MLPTKRNQPVNKGPKRTVTKRHRSKFGGRSTAIGVGYEAEVAAFIAVKMLAGDGFGLWDGVSGEDVVAVTMQDAVEVDDVVVELRGERARAVYISAKHRAGAIALTAKSVVFTDVVTSFVRQFFQIIADSHSGCRLVWAVPSTAGRKVTKELRGVLNTFRADDCTSLPDFLKRRHTKERETMKMMRDQTKRSWKEIVKRLPTDAELCEFIRLVHVEVFDFGDGGRSEQSALETIRDSLAAKPAESQRVWGWLNLHFRQNNERGLRRTAATLRQRLTAEARVKLKAAPTFEDDIKFLGQLTARNLERLTDHTLLRFPKTEIHIERKAELTALVVAAKRGHLLITGEPGCGKSGLMHPLAATLVREGIPVVLLLAEEIFGKDWNGLPNLPGVSHVLDDVLANWPNGAQGVLITDALDSLRDVDTQKLLRRLLQDVQRGNSGWTVVASVREFDLKHGRELRETFPGLGVENHTSSEFAGVAHFHVTGLTDAHLDALIVKVAEIGPFIASASASNRAADIHRSPFFLRLAAELLRAGVSAARLADWSSPAVLLRRFWEKQFQSGAGASARESALHTICGRMVELRTMALSMQDVSLGVPERDAVTELRSRGILQSPTLKHGSTVGGGELRFSHHLLHDYAVARSMIPDTSASFSEFAIRNPLMPIFYRQSFLLALEELWDGQDSRAGFWETALKLEGVASLHGVSRNLAPILAGRRVDAPSDLQPLADAVAASTSEDSPAEKAIRHMASGLQDVADDSLRAGAGAWCGFAAKLATMLPGRASLETPLVHIVARLNAVSAAFGDGPLRDLNAAARGLFAHHVAKGVPRGWRYAGRTASETLCRTFRLAPEQTEAALCAMLSPERLAAFPHWDLFDLAQHIKHLGEEGDSVVLRLFDAAFSTEPETNEWEDFGGQIMPLRMQSRDNWNSIHHSLAGYYQSRPGANAGLMTELACIAWNAAVRRHERGESAERVIATFSFRGLECALVEDYGHIGDRRNKHDENRILTYYEALLDEWAAGNTAQLSAVLERFAARNRGSEMWKVFLKAGAKHPHTLGRELEPVLNESLFLTHLDYNYEGVLLFAALHESGDMVQRERLERLILQLPQTARFLREEPREPLPGWLLHAQNKLLGSLGEPDIVLQEVRALRNERQAQQPLPVNRKPEGFRFTSSTVSNEEMLERNGVSLKDPVNHKLYGLKEALKPFRETDEAKLPGNDFAGHWVLIGKCEYAVRRHRNTHPKMAEELWGHLVGSCQSVAIHAPWPSNDERWKTVRRILLAASNDPFPQAREDDAKEDRCSSWSWPAPRMDAAQGLPFLLLRLGRADKQVANALLRLCKDEVLSLRFNLAERLSVLSQVEPALMWQLVDFFIRSEKKFSVLEALLFSLDRLWGISAPDVMLRLARIAERARNAPDTHDIHQRIVEVFLFRFLRTGDSECESFVNDLVADCDRARAGQALSSLPGCCRSGQWLTVGDAVKLVAQEEAVRQRTWAFFGKLLSTAQAKLRQHREHWMKFHSETQPDIEALKPTQEAIQRTAHIVDDIALQLYFASGASGDEQNKEDDRPTEAQKNRFWAESRDLIRALADEVHPHTAHHVVQTLRYLLPCAPREVFLFAARAISSSSGAGYQHESLAVSEVVKLIQCALADHREIFHGSDNTESECLAALLMVLDLFVEAGWAEARQLTHRLEEIYR
jgi:hypothetical protein